MPQSPPGKPAGDENGAALDDPSPSPAAGGAEAAIAPAPGSANAANGTISPVLTAAAAGSTSPAAGASKPQAAAQIAAVPSVSSPSSGAAPRPTTTFVPVTALPGGIPAQINPAIYQQLMSSYKLVPGGTPHARIPTVQTMASSALTNATTSAMLATLAFPGGVPVGMPRPAVITTSGSSGTAAVGSTVTTTSSATPGGGSGGGAPVAMTIPLVAPPGYKIVWTYQGPVCIPANATLVAVPPGAVTSTGAPSSAGAAMVTLTSAPTAGSTSAGAGGGTGKPLMIPVTIGPPMGTTISFMPTTAAGASAAGGGAKAAPKGLKPGEAKPKLPAGSATASGVRAAASAAAAAETAAMLAARAANMMGLTGSRNGSGATSAPGSMKPESSYSGKSWEQQAQGQGAIVPSTVAVSASGAYQKKKPAAGGSSSSSYASSSSSASSSWQHQQQQATAQQLAYQPQQPLTPHPNPAYAASLGIDLTLGRPTAGHVDGAAVLGQARHFSDFIGRLTASSSSASASQSAAASPAVGDKAAAAAATSGDSGANAASSAAPRRPLASLLGLSHLPHHGSYGSGGTGGARNTRSSAAVAAAGSGAGGGSGSNGIGRPKKVTDDVSSYATGQHHHQPGPALTSSAGLKATVEQRAIASVMRTLLGCVEGSQHFGQVAKGGKGGLPSIASATSGSDSAKTAGRDGTTTGSSAVVSSVIHPDTRFPPINPALSAFARVLLHEQGIGVLGARPQQQQVGDAAAPTASDASGPNRGRFVAIVRDPSDLVHPPPAAVAATSSSYIASNDNGVSSRKRGRVGAEADEGEDASSPPPLARLRRGLAAAVPAAIAVCSPGTGKR